ncbi:MAG TPA: RNA polymerase sigma factor [Jatrophihabitans sp.]|nr:RNA polymerase sigma factor [Jatrophihabitans sp.]
MTAERPPSRRRLDTDPELNNDLERARTGDETSFVRIFRAIQPGLLRYVRTLVGADAEDVVSEAWSQVCRDLAKFSGDFDAFRGWVATIARYRAIDHLRARGRRPMDPVPVEELIDRAASESTEGSALESAATAAALAAIKSLPKDQAEAVLLRTVMGLDANAAGRVLGKRAGAVRVAAFRGLNNLAKQLEVERPVTPRNTSAVASGDEVR